MRRLRKVKIVATLGPASSDFAIRHTAPPVTDEKPMKAKQAAHLKQRATLETLPKSPAELAYPQMGYLTEIAQSEDYKEGVAAFQEKRKAHFKGR